MEKIDNNEFVEIKKTYTIPKDGDCSKCNFGLKDRLQSPFDDNFKYYCIPFDIVLNYELIRYGEFFSTRVFKQCSACKEYLAQENAKTWCD